MIEIQKGLTPVPAEVGFWFPIPEEGQVNFKARMRPERIVIPEKVISELKTYVNKTL